MTRLLLTISFCFSLLTLIAQKDNQIHTQVYFATDKHELTKDSRTILEALNTTLKQYPSFSIFVKGNTDADGSNSYNQQLSEKRVASVKAYLTKLGIPTDAFNVVAVGENEPIAENNSADGKQKNRRVDIIAHYSNDAIPLSQTIEQLPISIDGLFKELGNKAQSFTLTNESDTAIYGAKGTMIIIPVGSFDVPKGTKINFKVKEVLTRADMLLENLTTTAQDKLLNSGGMVQLLAETADGKPIDLKEGKKLAVKIPTTNYEPQMQYFYGSEQQNMSNLDWNLMNDAAVDINNSRNKVIFGSFSTNPWDDELERMTPVDNQRLAKYINNEGFRYGYGHFYYMKDNYYKMLYTAFTRDVCKELYDVKLVEKVDTLRRIHGEKGVGSFFKRLLTGQPNTYVTTEVVKKTVKRYEIKAGLDATYQSLALYGKQNNMERMGWEAIHQSKHRDLYDVLEVGLQAKGYDSIVKRLQVKIPHYDERLVDFRIKYHAKQDSFSKIYEKQQKFWVERRNNWFKKQEELVASRLATGSVSRNDINFYFFETNHLGWLNCDYFDKSPNAVAVTTDLKKAGNLDAKLVFQERMAAMPANTG
jgi:hypothetical protein